MIVQPVENSIQVLLNAGVLAMLRVGGVIAFAPIFNSAGVPAKVKIILTFAIAALMAPIIAAQRNAHTELAVATLLGEASVGVLIGLTLSLMNEALLFAGSMMSVSFSFSLANLMDPNSQVETDVLGTAFGWLGVLVLLGAGLHRVVLNALLHSFVTLPVGSIFLSAVSGKQLAESGSGIFLAGLQLAAPVVAAAMLVEVVIGLVSRMAPALPAQVASVPLKSLVSYVTLIGSLALWPGWIERHFTALLDQAQKAVRL